MRSLFHVFAVGGGLIDTADMLRNLPDMPGDNIFREADLRITHAHKGAGKFAGTLGSLTGEDRKILFADKNLKGKIITIKYQLLTSKPDSEGYYRLRFPAVIGLKEDRDFDTPEPVAAEPEKFIGKSNCTFRKNGDVFSGSVRK